MGVPVPHLEVLGVPGHQLAAAAEESLSLEVVAAAAEEYLSPEVVRASETGWVVAVVFEIVL